MAYEINGRQTSEGDRVEYTDPYKGKHEATIKTLEPKNGYHHATLETVIEDVPKTLTDVPWHADGVQYSWRHLESQ